MFIKAGAIGASHGVGKGGEGVVPRRVWSDILAAGFPTDGPRLLLHPRQPVERALQDEHRGMLVDHGLAFGAARIGGNQRPFDCRGRQPLVP
jgi:hypothetical protein